MGTIANGRNTPLNVRTGTVPDVSGAMRDWFQPMVFERVVKVINAFQVTEVGYTTAFRGVIQPLQDRQLQQKPEGQRAWTWLWLHAEPSLLLNVDEVVTYLGVQTRVMTRKDYGLYGYIDYHLVQDWTGAGPQVASTRNIIDGGDASTVDFDNVIDGGMADTVDYPNTIDGGTAAGS